VAYPFGRLVDLPPLRLGDAASPAREETSSITTHWQTDRASIHVTECLDGLTAGTPALFLPT
jgi:hypothetical protein